MALVKCAECDYVLTNKARRCPCCGYEPMGSCKNCQLYENVKGFDSGRCKAAKGKDFVRKDKCVCPAVIKKSILIDVIGV